MFDDILGATIAREEDIGSVSDSTPTSFGEIWAAKQRQIDTISEYEDDDFTDEYEGLQV